MPATVEYNTLARGVSNRTALAAANTSTGVLFLQETGREGLFKWNSADLSAEVTADAEQGIYVPPTGEDGSSGAWVRQHRGRLQVEWFGAAAANSAAQNLTALNGAQAAASALGGATIVVPDGLTLTLPEYSTSSQVRAQQSSLFGLASNVHLECDGRIEGAVSVIGEEIIRKDTVLGSGSLSAGIQSFSGDFSAFAADEPVLLELQGLGNSSNQFGKDPLTVATASGTTLTTDETTRWPYADWQISRIVAFYVAATLSRGDSSISGDYTATVVGETLQAGDWIQVRNKNGNDNPMGAGIAASLVTGDDKEYSEHVQIKAIDASAITLERPLLYDYSDFWIIKSDMPDNIHISGKGHIKQIISDGGTNVRYRDVEVETIGVRHNFEAEYNTTACADGGPTAMRISHSRGFIVSRPRTRNTESSTGNASLKLTAPADFVVYGGDSGDVTSSSNGCFALQIDGNYLPDTRWCQNGVLIGLNLEAPKGTTLLSAYVTMIRNGNVQSILGGEEIRFQYCDELTAMGIRAEVRIDWENMAPECQLLGFAANFMNIEGAAGNLISNGILRGTGGANSNRVLWARGSTPITTIDELKLVNIDVQSATAGDTSFYLSDGDRVAFRGLSDRSGLTSSVTFGSGMTNPRPDPLSNDLRNGHTAVDRWETATIASGALALEGPHIEHVLVVPESGAADDLNTLTGGVGGQQVFLRTSGAATVTAKDASSGANTIRMAGDFAMDSAVDSLSLFNFSTAWIEAARSDNA